MLFSVDVDGRTASPVSPTSFPALALRERFDIQEWVLGTTALLGEDLLIVTTEFDRFDRTSERLDVLDHQLAERVEHQLECLVAAGALRRVRAHDGPPQRAT